MIDRDRVEPNDGSRGLSLIVDCLGHRRSLDRFFESLDSTNTFGPLELICLVDSALDKDEKATRSTGHFHPVKTVFREEGRTVAECLNTAAALASFPLVLFTNPGLVFTRDVLPLAVAQMEDPEIAVAGMRLDDYPSSLPLGESPETSHLGVFFEFDPFSNIYRPRLLRMADPAEADSLPSATVPATGGDFFLTRRDDFLELGGFREELQEGYQYLDYCLRVRRENGANILCINARGVEKELVVKKGYHSAARSDFPAPGLELFNLRAGDQMRRDIAGPDLSMGMVEYSGDLEARDWDPGLSGDRIPGVSIIVTGELEPEGLESFLADFQLANTHPLVELIVVTSPAAGRVLQPLFTNPDQPNTSIIELENNESRAFRRNLGADNAVYPYLCFIDGIVSYGADALPGIVEKFGKDPLLGAAGVSVAFTDPGRVEFGEDGPVFGIRFSRECEKGDFVPAPISAGEVQEFQFDAGKVGPVLCPPALSEHFLFCRKKDYYLLNGFSEDYRVSLEGVDFCLRIQADLHKHCWCRDDCILEAGIAGEAGQETGGTAGSEEHGLRIFRRKWDSYLRVHFREQEIRSAPRAPETKHVWARACPDLTGREACLFAAYIPHGRLSRSQERYLKALRQEGLTVVLAAAVDRFDPLCSAHLCGSADAVLLRENRGFDFASWATVIDSVPSVWNARMLVLANDSVFGPSRSFGRLMERIRRSEDDVIGLTQSREHKWHLQSYFLVFKEQALGTRGLRKYWGGIKALAEKWSVVFEYEVGITSHCRSLGLSCSALFSGGDVEVRSGEPGEGNPTHRRWRELIGQGFPFIKAELLHSNPVNVSLAGWDRMLFEHGFDSALVKQEIPESLFARDQLEMIPLDSFSEASGARKLPEGRYQWACRDGLPAFDIDLSATARIADAWCAIGFTVTTSLPFGGRASLSTDRGAGWEKDREFDVYYSNGKPVTLVIRLDSPLSGVRFSPVSKKCRFTIESFGFTGIKVRQAENRMMEELLVSGRLFAESRLAFEKRHWGKGVEGPEAARAALYREYASIFSAGSPVPYGTWIRAVEGAVEGSTVCSDAGKEEPFLSVVLPIPDDPPDSLRMTLQSVLDQDCTCFELLVVASSSAEPGARRLLSECVDSCSGIKVISGEEDAGVVSLVNQGIGQASGRFVMVLDQGVLLSGRSLAWIADEASRKPEAQIIYFDEDSIDEYGTRSEPHFKPDWNPDLFLSCNYVSRAVVFKKALLQEAGGLRHLEDGGEFHDLLLRCLPHLDPGQIIHVPEVLCHHIVSGGASASDLPGGRVLDYGVSLPSVKEFLESTGAGGAVVEEGVLPGTCRIRYPVPDPAPLVTLLIMTRDKLELLKACVYSILERTDYPQYEIVIIDNRSREESTLAWFRKVQEEQERVRVIPYDHPFNFSAMANFGVGDARGHLIGFLNNDIEVINPEWLTEMAGQALRPEIGCVGAKLYFPDDTIQHAGVILGIGGSAGHGFYGYPRHDPGYFGRLMAVQNYSAVTAAVMLIRRTVYEEAGGMDEINLPEAYNDVDFCLRVASAGYRNLWTPHAELYHHESRSRGYARLPGQKEMIKKAASFLKNKWGAMLAADPAYNINLTREKPDFSPGFPGPRKPG